MFRHDATDKRRCEFVSPDETAGAAWDCNGPDGPDGPLPFCAADVLRASHCKAIALKFGSMDTQQFRNGRGLR